MAIGDRTEARLVGPVQLTATDAAVGAAVPSGRVWVVKQIIFTNTGGTDRLIYLGIGGAASGGVSSRFIHTIPIAFGDTLVLDTALVLTATERFWGFSDSASQVNVIVVGWEKQV